MNYILQGEVDTIGMPENFQYFEADMIDFENYLVKKDFCFRYNTIFVKVKGYYNPLIHFTPETIYFNIDIFKDAAQKDVVKVGQCWVDCLMDMGYSVATIEDFFYEVQNLDKSITQLMLYITFSEVEVDIYKKPVIYLYPEKEIELNVILNGVDFTTTYPKYENGWKVVAKPDGTLLDMNGREYNYLYWEGKGNIELDVSKGFVIEKENYIEFLEEKLDYVGLTNKESADFISYWLPYMNEYEYCQVSFQMENYEEQVKLDFSVKPDNELRVFAVFKGLDNPIEIEEQDLSYYNGFERTGFTVVEWGGTIIE